MFLFKTKTVKRLISFFTAFALVLCISVVFQNQNNNVYAAFNSSEFSSGYSHPTQMRGLSASEIAADMGAGWNLGNSLESEYNETHWGNPKTTKAMIDAIAAKGFKTLRVPVRWDDNYSNASSYTISSDFMDRVETVVNYGLSNDMYVIINIHHNDLQTMVSTDSGTQWRVKNEISAIWNQVGNRFKNYGDKLIFEVNNEPRAGEDWGGNSAYYDCVNQYNEAGRAAIRATGGNNSSRLVMLPTYCASGDSPKLYGWQNLSNDKMVAVSVHAYKPFDFAFEGSGHSNWLDSDYNELTILFNDLNNIFIKKGIPVVMGEFGCTNKNNTYDREKHVEIYTSMAKNLNIPCVWWDNNCFSYGSENFGIFDRNSYTFKYDGIAQAIVKTYKNSSGGGSTGGQDEDNYVSIFYGNSSASSWKQAVSVATTRNSGNFDAANIKTNGHFYVEYSGAQGELELILQSFSGGAAWAKVNPSENGRVNGRYYAKFSYSDCVSAFGTSDFTNKLDKIYVGAKNNSISVKSVCYNFGNSSGGGSSSSGGDSYVSLFWGSLSSTNWDQAVSVMTAKNGGKFDTSLVTSDGYFYVEYSGSEKQIEFILQSWSGGSEWTKVSASEYGSANGHYYAKFSYENCSKAFGSNNFGALLDQIHVSAKRSQLTVYSVCYCYPN